MKIFQLVAVVCKLVSTFGVQFISQEWHPILLNEAKLPSSSKTVDFSTLKNPLSAVLLSKSHSDLTLVCQNPTTGMLFASDVDLGATYYEKERTGVLLTCFTNSELDKGKREPDGLYYVLDDVYNTQLDYYECQKACRLIPNFRLAIPRTDQMLQIMAEYRFNQTDDQSFFIDLYKNSAGEYVHSDGSLYALDVNDVTKGHGSRYHQMHFQSPVPDDAPGGSRLPCLCQGNVDNIPW